ncbi:MAG: DUF4339 domain-containing protein [Bryobacteraceae bacterium]
MNYYVKRDGQEHGPYSIADLQQQREQGKIQPTDFARSDGLHQWLPVQHILDNIVASEAPPRLGHGQLASDAPTSGSRPARPSPTSGGPIPPGLHWALVLLLSIVTLYLFGIIWSFVEAIYAQNLRTKSKPLLFYSLGFGLAFASGVMSGIANLAIVAGFVQIAGSVLLIAGHFSLKNALEEYYNQVEPIGLQLSGVMTFFFNIIYFQYHLSQIRKWKQSGNYNSGRGSYLDLKPKKGMIYTQSELEAMQNHPSQV